MSFQCDKTVRGIKKKKHKMQRVVNHNLEKFSCFNIKPWDADNCLLILVKGKKDLIFKQICKYDKANFWSGWL